MSVDRVEVREVVGARCRGHAVARHVPGHELGGVGQARAEQSGQSQCRVLDCRGGEIVDLPRIDLLLCDSQG